MKILKPSTTGPDAGNIDFRGKAFRWARVLDYDTVAAFTKAAPALVAQSWSFDDDDSQTPLRGYDVAIAPNLPNGKTGHFHTLRAVAWKPSESGARTLVIQVGFDNDPFPGPRTDKAPDYSCIDNDFFSGNERPGPLAFGWDSANEHVHPISIDATGKVSVSASITGTPNVNVVNQPVVTPSGGAAVGAVNPLNPVPVAVTDGGSAVRAQLGDTSGRTLVVGAAADGAAVAGNPLLSGGSDGANARALKTDTSGRQQVVGAAAAGAAVAGNPVLMAGSDGANAQNLKTDTNGRVLNGADTSSVTLFNGTSPGAASTVIQAVVTFAAAFRKAAIHARLLGATGGTSDVYVQTSLDGGTTWTDVVHFPQLAAAAAAVAYAVNISRDTSGTTITVVNSADGTPILAANTVVPGVMGDRFRVVHVAGAGTTLGAAHAIRALLST